MTLPVDIPVLILSLGSIIVLYLYFREYKLRQKVQREGAEFLDSIQEKSWETIHSSVTKSQDILSEAEMESLKVVTDSKFYTQKMEEEYKNKLSEIIKQTEGSINNSHTQLIEFMNNLQKEGMDIKVASEKLTQERINKLFDTMETRLSDFLTQTSQRTSSSIELELKGSRALIETYKQEQLKLIDENILAMMEQTLALVLNKKLSLQDQLDLIYEALEKAKAEKFII